MEIRTFAEIDAKRERLGVIQRDLCGAADVHESTYSKAKLTAREPMPRIRRKLWAALDRIAEERGLVVLPQGEVSDAAE